MSKPYVHALASVHKFGGRVEDYLAIHSFMDSSKGAIADNRHRALTHTSWFIAPGSVLELVFGVVISNSDGKAVSVRDIGEQHILEDYQGRFIPTAQDFLYDIPPQAWHDNGHRGIPPSCARIMSTTPTKRIVLGD